MGPEAGRGLIPFLFGSLIFSPNYDLTPVVIDNPQLPGTRPNPENNGINYQPQLVSSISAINWSKFFCWLSEPPANVELTFQSFLSTRSSAVSCTNRIRCESLRIKEMYALRIRLMERILHQLIGSLSHYLQGFIHRSWCRISSINC